MNDKTQRYFLELSYKGSPFHGWQVQQNAFTVQECLEKALSTYFRTPITILGSGRTDTGVHAQLQVCHFDLQEMELGENFLKALNAILPKEIGIHAVRKGRHALGEENVHVRTIDVHLICQEPVLTSILNKRQFRPLKIHKLNSSLF
jgi:tRNA pseudouridine(38-40) synthase